MSGDTIGAAPLTGKVAVVTGASSGIGKAIAVALAASGASVVLAARRIDAITNVAEAIRTAGGAALPIGCDVADANSVATLFNAIDSDLGPVDLLINNAGTLALHPFDELPVAEWDRVVAVNLRGLFLCSQQAFTRMKRHGGGRIINIGSLSAMRVRAGNAAYNATKFALEGLTHSLALEGRPFGIACSVLHPGNTRSEITDMPGFTEPRMAAEDVARAVTLMATSPEQTNIFKVVMHPVEQVFIGRG